jgi:hypothetical protein
VVTTQDIHDVVRASPAAVAAHDKERWIALFDDEYVIEDPVGWRPVRGDDISAFWDAFIAPNDIRFDVHHDWIEGLHVVRDVDVVTTLGTGLVVTTPAHLRYELVERAEGLKVARMAAHWEVLPNVAQLMKPRGAHLRSMAAMNGSMLRHLGLRDTARFAAAVRSVGRRGKDAVRAHLGSSVDDLHKVIASGSVVTANGTVDGNPAAVVATLDRRTRAVLDCRVYTDRIG